MDDRDREDQAQNRPRLGRRIEERGYPIAWACTARIIWFNAGESQRLGPGRGACLVPSKNLDPPIETLAARVPATSFSKTYRSRAGSSRLWMRPLDSEHTA